MPDEGETSTALQRRLGAAAQLLGKNPVVNRQEGIGYFWLDGSGPAPRRRGRPRKTSTAAG